MKSPSPGKITLFLTAFATLAVSGCLDESTDVNPFPEVDLKDTGNQADMVMIAPRALTRGLPRLVEHRVDQGLTVTVVTLEEIADAFPEIPLPGDAIRAFVAYAVTSWQAPKVEYVLLVGDTDLIPTFIFDSRLSVYGEDQVAVDDPYSTVEGDDDEFPDLALGRFPVSNLKELKTVVNKTLAFELSAGTAYAKDGLLVADYAEHDPLLTFFETETGKFESRFPETAALQRIDLRPESPYHGTRTDFFAALEAGARTLAYSGRGDASKWSESELLTLEDLLDAPNPGKPSFVVAATSTQRFDDYGENTLVRRLALLDSGGAVASLAPSGIISAYAGLVFLQTFWEVLWSDPDQTVGKAVLAAKRAGQAGSHGDFESDAGRFTLLGDPALRLSRP